MRISPLLFGAALIITPANALCDQILTIEEAFESNETDTRLVSWCDNCTDSLACGDAACCGDTCCGDSCCECCQPLSNCGLLGKGILTHDSCGKGCPLPGLVLGCFCKSESCYDDFISPMTNPVYFEDPRNTTEFRAFFLHHKVPLAAGGGDIQLWSVQIRARLNEDWSLIATKDGFATSDNPLIDDGWGDVSLGLKRQVYRDPHNQRLASVGFAYDAPVGSTRTLQGRGDGMFHVFATGGTQLGCYGHWVSNFGGEIPVDDDASNSFIYWSNHFDYQIRRGWYGLLEFNWYHFTGDGDDSLGLTGVSGGDLFNFGSAGVDGNDIVTGAFGAKYKPNRKTEIGVAFEVPLTDRRDVTESRLTLDWIMRY